MKVWAITFDPSCVKNATFDNLYTRALELVDIESQTKIKKFYKREDAFRSLIGRLLPRMILCEQGIPHKGMSFAKTQANKPYINIPTPVLPEPIGYNVTHDAGVVAMAYAIGSHQPWIHAPAHRIGIDIMRLGLPDRFTFQGFVRTVGDALTTFEKSSLDPTPSVSESESLYHFYLIWTIKEAYTKALGLGLGFDFRRVEYDNSINRIRVDGVVLKGWEFDVFRLPGDQDGGDGYVGVAAKFVGGNEEAVIRKVTEATELVSTLTAEEFLVLALKEFAREN